MSDANEARTTERPSQETDEQEPDLRGTLLLTTLLLIMIFGFWALMYLELIGS